MNLLFFLLFFPTLFSFSLLQSPITATKNSFDSQEGVMQFVWGETNPSSTFLLTFAGTLYWSKDEGKTWKKQVQSIQSSQVSFMVARDDRLFLVGPTASWTSKNISAFPVTFQKTSLTNAFYGSFHPTNPDWLLAIDRTQKLYITQDFGQSWTLISSDVSWLNFEWGLGNNPNVVYFIATRNGTTVFYSYTVTSKVINSLIPMATSFNKHGERIFVSTSNGMMVCRDGVNFRPTFFTHGAYFGSQYSVVESNDGAIFVGVSSPGDQYAHVFKSDSTGTRYSLSFPFTSSPSHQSTAFETFHGLEGIFFANELTNFNDQRASNFVPILKTKVTYDNGAEWNFLTAPSHDHEGHPIICLHGCHLHLHTMSSFPRWGPMYSSKNVVGVMMATGNLGRSLSTEISNVNTYLSRDAGLTWKEVRKGSSIYEFGDHGGLIVMADNFLPTTQIYYSLDEAITWQTFTFAVNPVSIANVIIEPSSTGKKFMLYGTEGTESVIYHLDFSAIHERDCDASDYENFTPHHQADQCLLGRQVTYTRKKQDSKCFNAKMDSHVLNSKNCSCTTDDYECDVGYEWSSLSQQCVMTVPGDIVIPSPCPEGTTFLVPTGYRKIGGDSCVGTISGYEPKVPADCPKGPVTPTAGSSGADKSIIGLIIGLIVLILLITVAVVLMIRNKEKLRELFAAIFKKSDYHPLNINNDNMYDDAELDAHEDNHL